MNAPTLTKTCAPATREEAAEQLAEAVRVFLAYGGSAWTIRETLAQYDRAKEQGR